MKSVKSIFKNLIGKKNNTSVKVYHGMFSIRRQAKPLYYIIRSFFRLVVFTQHNETKAIGQEHIPPDGSVLLVGNHPNSYLDYFNLINAIRHPVATAAKDVITNWPILGPILRHHMLMIPIARRMDQDVTGMDEETRKNVNVESVRETVDLLVKGRLLNIFGEGKSTDSRKLNRIKLGFMHIAIQAEKEFNFKLNLRVVPFGLFYDRINKFQSSAVIVFGKSFKLNNLIDIPENFLALSPSEQSSFEKKLMVAGKDKMQASIESLIISISDKNLVDLVDDASALYVLTPRKYMGKYKNIKEKYFLSKTLSDCIQAANKEESGSRHLDELKNSLTQYRRELKKCRVPDSLVRREHSFAEFGYHLRVLIKGILFSPLIVYGKVFNFIPHRAGRFARYWVINIKRKQKVEGDEQAMTAATIFALSTYPVFGAILGYLTWRYGLDWFGSWLIDFGKYHRFQFPVHIAQILLLWSKTTASVTGIISVYLMARLWRFALKHGYEFKSALFWMKDSFVELTQKFEINRLREMRYKIIDKIDFIIGEYDE